jgi:hypothetical protein
VNDDVVLRLKNDKVIPDYLSILDRCEIYSIKTIFKDRPYEYIDITRYNIINIGDIKDAFNKCYNVSINTLNYLYDKEYNKEDLISAFNASNMLPELMKRLGYEPQNTTTVIDMEDVDDYNKDEIYHIFFRDRWYQLTASECYYMKDSKKFIHNNAKMTEEELELL